MIGQRCVQQQIKNEIDNKSLARFIILLGDIGSGRKTLAKEMCGWLGATYVLVDKGVDAIREVIEQSYSISAEMVYVLDGDNMSSAAKSALLKVTEEPPNKARFVLTLTNVEHTLDTLVSRARIYRLDNYTAADIIRFAGSEDWRYRNFCSNKYEVDLLKSYGIDDFYAFVKKVVDNISVVNGANALKMEQNISFTDGDGKYDMKIFLQAFRTECIDRVHQFDCVDREYPEIDYPSTMKYLDWIGITNKTLDAVRLQVSNRQHLFDKWIFDIRAVSYAKS